MEHSAHPVTGSLRSDTPRCPSRTMKIAQPGSAHSRPHGHRSQVSMSLRHPSSDRRVSVCDCRTLELQLEAWADAEQRRAAADAELAGRTRACTPSIGAGGRPGRCG